jgi:hypothetical protein
MNAVRLHALHRAKKRKASEGKKKEKDTLDRLLREKIFRMNTSRRRE